MPCHFLARLAKEGKADSAHICSTMGEQSPKQPRNANVSGVWHRDGDCLTGWKEKRFTSLSDRRANAIARPLRKLVMPSHEVGYYHVYNRCVRGGFLLAVSTTSDQATRVRTGFSRTSSTCAKASPWKCAISV